MLKTQKRVAYEGRGGKMRNTKRRITGLTVFLILVLAVCFSVSAAAAPRISRTKKTVYAGETYKLNISGYSGTVKWSSGNKAVAVVSSKGKVTARKAGTAVITARCGNIRKTCKIIVKPVKLNKTKLQKYTGKTITVKLLCGMQYRIYWRISNASALQIVSADRNMITLKTVNPGTAVLTCKYHNKTYKCKITVVKQAAGTGTGTAAASGTGTSAAKPEENIIIFG